MFKPRQPIVTVLGHVDHGKTSLLDALRNTSVYDREAGGITQSIGASVLVTKEGKKITFIDTPGHAAFSNMRSRGAKVADIAILVVASSEGVKPQTKEAIGLIKEANIPFIVAVTKIDLPNASVETTLGELEKEEIYFEGRGGQTPYIPVSAKEKKGLTELVDMVLLLSEVNDLKSDEQTELEALVIETNKEKGGNSVSVVVRNGTLKIGDSIYAESVNGKARGLFDWLGKPVKEVFPGEPVKVLGFEGLPPVGAVVKKGISGQQTEEKINKYARFDKTKIPLVLKASTSGALEALVASIPQEFTIVASSVGDVTESDVLDAKANGAMIFAFESKIPGSVTKLAEMDSVKVQTFRVIYELLQKLDEIVKGGIVEITGKAEILAEFPFDGKRVAGSKVITGRINKTDKVKLMRGEQDLGFVKILSIKKQKQEVPGVGQGEECGILFAPQLDFVKGDILQAQH